MASSLREAPAAQAGFESLPPDCLAHVAELGFTSQLSPLFDRGDLLGAVRRRRRGLRHSAGRGAGGAGGSCSGAAAHAGRPVRNRAAAATPSASRKKGSAGRPLELFP